jgi:hypothetical protein
MFGLEDEMEDPYVKLVKELDEMAAKDGYGWLQCLLSRSRNSRFYRGQCMGREDDPTMAELIRARDRRNAA